MKANKKANYFTNIKERAVASLARIKAYAVDMTPRRIAAAAAIPICVLGAVFVIPAPINITRDTSASFKDVVADRSRPVVGHSYKHSGKTDFLAVSAGLREKCYWFVYGNRKRGKIESFARACGGWILGADFDNDMDGAFVITDKEYGLCDALKPGRYVYLGKIRSRTWFLKEFVWEHPVYMDESLPRAEKVDLLANFRRDMVKALQQDNSGKKVTMLENGVLVDGGLFSSNRYMEIL